MKGLLYLILCLVSFYANSALYNINKSYQGDPFFKNVNMQKLEEDCSRSVEYWNDSDVHDEEERRCPLNSIKFDYRNVFNLIEQDPIVYKDDNFQLEISLSSDNIILSLIHNHQVKDKIKLYGYMNDGSSACGGWVAYQRYYISSNGDIYTLWLTETEDGISPTLWKHYKIDSKNKKFILKEMLINRYYDQFKIVYPDKFSAISNNKFSENSNKQFDDSCLNECEEGYYCSCYFDLYSHYQRLLENRIIAFNEKNKTKNKSITLLKNRINSKCLSFSPPDYDDTFDSYLINVMSCFIDEYKDEIKKLKI